MNSHNNSNNLSKADRWFQRAFAAHQAGKIEEAKSLYEQVLKKTPTDMETLYLLGTACSQLGKFVDATKYLKKALDIDPEHPETLNNMGLTLKALREYDAALMYYERALALRPDYADAHNNLGNVLELLGKLDEAESHLRRALELNPGLADAYYNLGLVLKGKDRFEEAAQCFLRGIQLKPDFDVAYNDLGQIYKIWGRFEAALACFDHALTLTPEGYSLHNNRGATLEELGRLDEALQEYEYTANLVPDLITPKWNLAFLFLRQGVLDRGWDYHELRFKTGQVENRFPYPEWDGSSLEGKTVLIYAEQGLGDEILFASCFSDMLAKARHCVIECEPRLEPLFSRSFPSATVRGTVRTDISWLSNAPEIDVQVAAGSLPRFLRPTIESFPAAPAYLVPNSRRVNYWRARMAELGPGIKIGICWRSGLAKGERHRSYSELIQWGEIFNVPGAHFVNLQYGECADELHEAEEKFGVKINSFSEIDLRNEIDETAALILSLDLVISAATALAETAGSVGAEVYRTDPYGDQWVTLGTDRMPWHPSMQLFRQPSQDDWETPLALIAEAVRDKALKDKTLSASDPIEYIRLRDGVEIAVNGSLDDLSTYVLKEQKGWFDPEYEFVLGMTQSGMRIVDVSAGSGVGAYAIPMANKLSGGRLWAITHTASETNLLMKSRSHNRLENKLNIAIAGKGASLDAEMDRHGLDDIAFVRVAHGLSNVDFLGRAERFFSMNSPLVMYGTNGAANFDMAVAQWLMAHGYALYRLVPGLGVLVPLTSTAELDIYALNIFACKADRAASLETQNLLLRQTRALDNLPGIELKYWQDYMSAQPYAAPLLGEWINPQQRVGDWEVYWMALNLFAMANSADRPMAQRHACLQTASGVMTTLVKEKATLPRLLTLTRVLSELGMRAAAVNLLNQICELLNGGLQRSLDEPCLALSDTFAQMRPGAHVAEWIVSMVLARREELCAFSTFFTGQDSLAALQEVQISGFGGEEIDRRIKLIKDRFSAPGGMEHS